MVLLLFCCDFRFVFDLQSHAAAQGNDLTTLRTLCEQQSYLSQEIYTKLSNNNNNVKIDIDILDDDGWNALMYASYYGHNNIITILKEYNSNINTINPNGSTALHLASGCGHIETVKLLLQYGADRDIRDHEKRKAIDTCKEIKPENWTEIVNLLQ